MDLGKCFGGTIWKTIWLSFKFLDVMNYLVNLKILNYCYIFRINPTWI